MTKADILNALINHYCRGNKSQFAKKIGISAQGLSTWISRNTFDIEAVYSKCENISADWLITGNGEMFKQTAATTVMPIRSRMISTSESSVESVESLTKISKKEPGAIPLVSENAVGGFTNEHFAISERDILGYYIIPKFRHLGVDFMIEVVGDSMIPRFYPGDIVACSIINNPRFIQWNKCHLIASREQGLLVKRLMPGHSEDCFCAVSDNTSYPPFDIPKDDIEGLARIVGSIHLE